MSFTELFLIGIGLSMDAFAVAICRGLSMKKLTLAKACIVGLYFGVFQALMPLIGYFLGASLSDLIKAYDHWISFALLAIIGGRMIYGSLRGGDDDGDREELSIGPRAMIPLAFATSVDALAVGVSFAFLEVDIVPAISLIGVTTFVLSMIGVKAGHVFGVKFKARAELAGGIILILIGLKILLEHLEILSF